MKLKQLVALLFLFSFSSFLFPQNSFPVLKETKLISGFSEPHTPAQYNQTGYVRYYSAKYQQKPAAILVLVSGFISGPAWFENMAARLVEKTGLEVWVTIRRQSFLENREEFYQDIDEFLKNPVPQNKILKKILNASHYLPKDSSFLEYWGFETQIMDLKAVIESAKKQSNSVFLGGWSDGVEYVMIYSQKRFPDGKMGFEDLKGLVLLDENPEWGNFSDYKTFANAHQKLIQEKSYFFDYKPALPFYSLAFFLAKNKPDDISPLSHLLLMPGMVKRHGITNKALIGWLFEAKLNFNKRGSFSYYTYSGTLDGKFPAGWKNEDSKNTKIEDLIYLETKQDFLFEWFYPRKVIQDYWEMGECGFSCTKYGIENTKNNKTPIFYTLSGSQASKELPKGLTWFLSKSGISEKQVSYKSFPDYGHADWFLGKDADGRLYQPLYEWLIKNRDN